MEKAKHFARLSIFLISVMIFQLVPIRLAQAAVTPPAFELYPSSGSYYLSCQTATVNMRIYTNNTATDSANIIVNYDSAKATITDADSGTAGTQITPGTAYSNYASYTVDQSTDRILMTGFNISSTYNSGAGYGLFGSFNLTPTQAGTANFNIDFTPSSTTDSNIAETVTSNDILNDVQNASFTFVADATLPYLDTYSPAQNATNVAISQNVTFRIHDDECGVDLSTLQVTVKGITYTQSGGNTFSASGTPGNYLITVNPSANFGYGETVNVSVVGDDLYGNSLATSNYSFTTIADTTPPAISNRNPAASATGVSNSSNVAFTISDAVSGVDIDTVSVTVKGVTYTKSGANTFGYSGNSSSYTITVNPSSNFTYGETINVSIDAEDINNNAMTTDNYSFTVETDTTPPTISNRSPAASATNVAINSNVTFTVADATSGVDLSTLSVVVGGVTYTQSGPNTFGYSGSPSSYNITVNPAVDFTRNSTINVTINVSDLQNNAMTQNAYSFSVIENSVPVITAIADKTVTAGDLLVFIVQASDSDGDTISIIKDAPALPAAAKLTNVSATQWIFTWTPTESDVGVYSSVDFVASDNGPGSSTYIETIQITVNTAGLGNNAPSLTSINDQTVYKGSILNLILHATDPEGDTITLTATTPESSALTKTNISNGLANLNIDTSVFTVGTHVITVNATDTNSNTSQKTFSVTVNALSTPTTGNSPTIQTISDQNITQGSVIRLTLSASDIDNDVISLTASTASSGALTVTNISSGLATLTIDTSKLSVGTNTITVTATDDEDPSNSTQSTFSVIVTAVASSTCTGSSTPTIYGGSAPAGFDPFTSLPHLMTPATTPSTPTNSTPVATATPNTGSTAITTVSINILPAAKETVTAPPAEFSAAPESVEPAACTPEIVEKEVVRYTSRAVSGSPDFAEPQLIYSHPSDVLKNSPLEPLVMVIQADERHQLDSFVLTLNGEIIPTQLTSTLQSPYRYYSLLHLPKSPYPNYSNQMVNVSFIQDAGGENDQYRVYSSNFHVQTDPEKTLYEAADVTPPSQKTPADLRLLVKNLVVNMDEYGLIYIQGETENATEVDTIWHGRSETLKVVKRVKGNKFKIRAPLHFENGGYFVDVVGRHASGVETEPARVTFTVKNDFVKYDAVPGRDVLYINRAPWWPLFLLPIVTTLWYWRKSRVKRPESRKKS